MKLSDVMSAMQLSTYAELGLVLFLFAFVLVAIDLARKNKEELEHAEQLPLDDPRPSQERSP
jgi:cbb3-type cytochrome oxidase subunit 3